MSVKEGGGGSTRVQMKKNANSTVEISVASSYDGRRVYSATGYVATPTLCRICRFIWQNAAMYGSQRQTIYMQTGCDKLLEKYRTVGWRKETSLTDESMNAGIFTKIQLQYEEGLRKISLTDEGWMKEFTKLLMEEEIKARKNSR